MPVTHAFVSTKVDGTDTTLVRPSNWNAGHVVVIVNADVDAAAAIALTKLATGALPIGITVASANIVDRSVTTVKIADAAITPSQIRTNAVVALGDISATLTAAQMINSGIFTITPTAARTLTTDTAANLVAGMPRYQIGTWFDIIIVNNAAFDVTLVGGAGVTLVGRTVINNDSGTWRARFDSATAVAMYRM